VQRNSLIQSTNEYTLKDLFRIPFIVAPFLAGLRLFNRTLSALIPSLQILVTAKFVDTAIGIFNGRFPTGEIYLPLGWLLGIVGYHFANGALMNFVNLKFGIKLAERFRMDVIEKRARLAYRHIEDADTWDLIHRVSADPAGRIDGGYGILLRLFDLVIRIISVLVILFTQVWWIAFVIVLFSAPLFYAAIKSGKLEYDAYKEAAKHERKAGYLQSVIIGRENVEERTLFSYTENLNGKWHDQYEIARKINLRVTAGNFIKMKGASLITIGIALLITGVLIPPLHTGTITIGMFIGLVTASFQLVQLMSFELSYMTKELANNKEYLKDLTRFARLSETKGALSLPDRFAKERGFHSIECRNVSFRYPGTSTYVLRNLSLKLDASRQYAFVGANGAGKTTLIKILTGLYDEYEGEILLNNRDLREYDLAELKGLYGIVYQDFAKYSVSLRENLMLGEVREAKEAKEVKASEEARQVREEKAESETKMFEIAGMIGLSELIGGLSQGIDTPLGRVRENGVDLSGGEWQRVAIARVLMKDAPLYVLDEPTASLDPIVESAVYKLFGRVVSGKSAILITHRLGAARIADEILVFDDGRIAESGSHRELMDKGGVYARMYESQRSWYD
jgi:ATP-binding cassette, subfamily B, bacterial